MLNYFELNVVRRVIKHPFSIHDLFYFFVLSCPWWVCWSNHYFYQVLFWSNIFMSSVWPMWVHACHVRRVWEKKNETRDADKKENPTRKKYEKLWKEIGNNFCTFLHYFSYQVDEIVKKIEILEIWLVNKDILIKLSKNAVFTETKISWL